MFYSKSVFSFALGILGVVCIPYTQAETLDPVMIFSGAPGQTLPDGWKSDGDELSASEIKKSDSSTENISIHLSIQETGGDGSGQLLHSPKFAVQGASRLKLNYQWTGEGLYDDPANVQKSFARVEIFFISSGEEYLPGATKWYFGNSDNSEDKIDVEVPEGAAKFAVRIGLTRMGDSLGVPSSFTVGNFAVDIQ